MHMAYMPSLLGPWPVKPHHTEDDQYSSLCMSSWELRPRGWLDVLRLEMRPHERLESAEEQI